MDYTLHLNVRNVEPSSDRQFKQEAHNFLDELQSIDSLDVTIPAEPTEGSRGFIELLNQIVVTGASIGAFSAIYILAKDLYARYVNAEVELVFPDGSSLILKNLTQRQAEEKLEEHFLRQEKSDDEN